MLQKLAWMTSELQTPGEYLLERDTLQLPLSTGYDVLLSLLVPEPEIMESQWDIKHGVKGNKSSGRIVQFIFVDC